MVENLKLENINEYLNKNAYRVIEGMVNDLLLNQPEDVVEFMIVWLKEKGNQVLMNAKNNEDLSEQYSESSDYDSDEQDNNIINERRQQAMEKGCNKES